MKIIIYLVIIAFPIATALCQKNITILFYNTENFYDTINDPKSYDDDFTVDGVKKWNSKRYYKKLNNISKVITSVNSSKLPDIIGLAEVENNHVLQDLINLPIIKKENYRFIHDESPDEEGLDVALLYKSDIFKYLYHKNINVESKENNLTAVRDILYVMGIINKDTIHIFVNHWKSRADGQKKTEAARIYSAKILKKAINEIIDKNKKAKIIVMGDFNDEPTDKSIFKSLDATNRRKNESNDELYNPYYDLNNTTNEGTIYYNDKWQLFDQIMVSQGLIKSSKGLFFGYGKPNIFKADWLLTKDSKTGKLIPKQTFMNKKYYGGYSNHLPVYLIFDIK